MVPKIGITLFATSSFFMSWAKASLPKLPQTRCLIEPRSKMLLSELFRGKVTLELISMVWKKLLSVERMLSGKLIWPTTDKDSIAFPIDWSFEVSSYATASTKFFRVRMYLGVSAVDNV